MQITKKIDRRLLSKLLNGMYQYVVTITFDTDSGYITISDSHASVQLKAER